MALSADAARQVEQDLLTKADVLVHYLTALETTDARRAHNVLIEIISRLEQAVPADDGSDARPALALGKERRSPALVSQLPAPGDDVEEFILANLANSPRGMSVQEMVDYLDEAAIEMRRATLVVRLHRMERAGKLISRTHGHYILSDDEDARRRSIR